MAAGLLIVPEFNPATDRYNNRIAAKLWFYVNQAPGTPKTVYSDAGLTTPLAQPVESDALGEFPLIYADTADLYTVVGEKADGQTKTLDDFNASTAANSGVYDATVEVYNETVVVRDDTIALYGDLAAVQAAVTAAEGSATAAAGSATTAQDQVPLATEQAEAAAESATTATEQAGIATAQAVVATTQAGLAAAAVSDAKATSASVLLVFQNSTADADPGGPGGVRLNNVDPTLATFIYVNNSDKDGNDQQALWDNLDDSTSTNKGQIYLKEGASAKLAIYVVTGAVVNGTGYRKIPVSYVSGTGSAFTDGATIGFNFSRTGDAAANASIGYVAKTGAYTVVAADWGKIIDCTSGTFTLTYTAAGTLGAGFHNYIRNSGPGVITGPTVDGVTLTLNPGDEVLVEGDGAAFHALTLRQAGWWLFRMDTVSVAVGSVAVTNIPQNRAALMFEFPRVGLDTGTESFRVEISTNNGSSYSSPQSLVASVVAPNPVSGGLLFPHYRADVEVAIVGIGATVLSPALSSSGTGALRAGHTGGMNAARFSFSGGNLDTTSVIKTWMKN